MINATDIAFTGYPVTDMTRSRSFYEGVLGLTPTMVEYNESQGLNWTEYDIGSNTLALACVRGWEPSPKGATIALEVENLETAISSLQRAGVRFDLPKHETPVCRFCTILDPDNNQIMLHQRKSGHP